jgi:transcriptional regulator with XRE-family HTH domain
MKNDKLRQFLQQEAKPMAGWEEFKDGMLNADREEQRYRFRIAAKILEYIADNDLTQKAFAERIGCKPQYLGRVLKGKQDLRLSTMLKIQRAMDTDLIRVAEESFVEAKQPVVETKVAYGKEVVFTQAALLNKFPNGYSDAVNPQFFSSSKFQLPEMKQLSYQKLVPGSTRYVAADDVNKIPEVIANA